MTKDGHKRFLCKMCFNSFDTENKLNDHEHYCANNKAAKIVLPEPYNKTLEFENNGDYKPPVEYSGPNVAQEFINCMENEEEAISKLYYKIVPMETLNNYIQGYDAHLFIKEFGNDDKRIKLIPNNEEKYISFSKMIPRVVSRKGKGKDKEDKDIVIFTELRFIDSLKFLPNLVTRKLAYPYEYINCSEKFDETCLPPTENFYSSLNDKNVTIDEYENSQKIWKVFNIQNLREFTKLYNLIDSTLHTTPGFAWDCMLRMTKVKLDLLTDIDQILMFESGIRGDLSQCSQRYSKANNKYMGDKFKKKEESIFLQYLDANNLYGWAISKYLPTGDFKWIDNLNNFDINYLDNPNTVDNKQLPKLLTTLVLEFSQSPWLKVYIDFNTNLRSEAKNEFEKEYLKLMNNSVYGRTMMNVRNHMDNFYRKFSCSPMKRTQISFKQPIYIGMVLDTEKEIKKAKGVKKYVVENKICFNDFQSYLLTKEPKYVKQNLFRTKKHDIFTIEQNKIALSVYDDKRFILDN
ncbi:hypothetical protein AGLY_006767, partial [Aphis glycines]